MTQLVVNAGRMAVVLSINVVCWMLMLFFLAYFLMSFIGNTLLFWAIINTAYHMFVG